MKLSAPICDNVLTMLGWTLTDVGGSVLVEGELWLAFDCRRGGHLYLTTPEPDSDEFLGPAATAGDLVRTMRLLGVEPPQCQILGPR